MKIFDVKEWLMIADEDLYAAKLLNEAYRKPLEIICYHCAQAIEKYLKGFLEHNEIIPDKIHDLVVLLNKCISIDDRFRAITKECKIIQDFTSGIRYPNRIQVTESDSSYAIKSTEKIKNLDVFNKIRQEIDESDKNSPKETK